MSKFRKSLLCFLLLGFLFTACSDKLSPEQEAKKEKEDIIKLAPISEEYEITSPSNELPKQLKLLSGKWIGKWNDVVPSQLVVTNVTKNKVSFIYSWGEIPQRDIEAGEISKTVNIDNDGKIIIEQEKVLTTFVVNTTLNKIIGAQIDGDEVSNIVMERVK